MSSTVDTAGTTSDTKTPSDARPETGDKTATFMARVVPWPRGSAAGYINLHWTSPGRPGMFGAPFQALDAFMQRAQQAAAPNGCCADVYYCLSRQAKAGKTQSGNVRAERRSKSSLALKAIWLDIDGNKPDKGYSTKAEALTALDKFIKDAKLPFPTAIVDSGNGYHVYWINHEPMEVSTWAAYAEGLWALAVKHGLKADAITTDKARILRIPGTFNHKQTPPIPVRLLHLDTVDLNFEDKLLFLTARAPVTATVTKAPTLDLSAFAGKKSPAALAHLDPKEGFNLIPDRPPVNPKAIFDKGGCPMYRSAFDAGGVGIAQPEWHLQILGTTFMENGHQFAHEISNKHEDYAPTDTEAMFARTKGSGVGWPSCKAFENAGCASCAGCPHKGKIKSPLNLALPQKVAAPQPSFVDPYAEFAGPGFPFDVLPPTLSKFVDAEHRAMGADPSALAMTALTIVAGAIHAETCVQAGEGWWEKAILWTALVGPPSSMKSPIIDKSKKPLTSVDHDRKKQWDQEYAIWRQSSQK